MLFQKAGLEPPLAEWTVLMPSRASATGSTGRCSNWCELAKLGPAATIQARVGSTHHPLCRALVDFPALEEPRLSIKANLLPSGVPEFCLAVGGAALVQAHAGNGIVMGHFLDELPKDRADANVSEWRRLAAKFQGGAVVTRCPAAWRTAAFVWGPPRGDGWLMGAVKEKFDPARDIQSGVRAVCGVAAGFSLRRLEARECRGLKPAATIFI